MNTTTKSAIVLATTIGLCPRWCPVADVEPPRRCREVSGVGVDQDASGEPTRMIGVPGSADATSASITASAASVVHR